MFSRIIKNTYFYTLLVLVIIGSVYFFNKKEDQLGFDFAAAELSDIKRVINVTGRVVPANEVDLAFESSGKVASVLVDVGDRVIEGNILVRLNSDGVLADLTQARARLKSALSKLTELKRGSRPEEITIQEIKVSNAELTFNESKQSLVDEIKSSFTKADDAVRNKIDVLFSNATSDNPKLNIQVNNVQYKINAESGRIRAGTTINTWKESIKDLSVVDDLEFKFAEAKSNVLKIRSFIEEISLVVNSLDANANLSQTTIDGYKSDVSTARTSMDTASTNLSTDIEGFRTNLAALNLASEELILMKAGNDPQDVISGEAAVEEAEANVLKFQSEFNKKFITAPISGLVTFIDVLPGEIVTANEIIVSLISDSQLEVVANIPETDIVEVSVGNDALIRLDAYDQSVVFNAKVIKINPAETIIDGVPVYKTTLALNESDKRIRSGMTTDVEILIIKKENILAVPRRAVFEDEGQEFVRIWNGTEIEKRAVKTGIVGSDGLVEIDEGVTIGENIITFIRDEKILNN